MENMGMNMGQDPLGIQETKGTPLRIKVLLWLALIGFFTFFWFFGATLSPFILGAIMAYGYRPIKRFFQKYQLSNTVCALILSLVTFGVFIYFFLNIIPMLGAWSRSFSSQIPLYRQAFWDFFMPLMPDFFKESGPQIQESMDVLLRQSMQWVGSLIMVVLHNGWALGQLMVTLALSPVIAFHFVRDGARIRNQFYMLIPMSMRSMAVLCLRDMDRALRQYFLGQVRVCAALMVYYGIFLFGVLHLPNAIALSIVSGMLVFIPYVGFFISVLTACMIGVVESGQASYVTSIVSVYVVGNILESVILTPYFVGSRTGLHPLCVLLAVLIGGAVKGILGIVLAIPLATILGALWRLLRKYYMHSTLYQEKKKQTRRRSDDIQHSL
jgi:predicted PurR-regulated permease PerM